jgi:hypothetical protein
LLPRLSNLTTVTGLIDLDQLGRMVQAMLGIRSMGSTLSAGAQVRDDGPCSDDQSLDEFGSRKIPRFCFGDKRLGQARMSPS